MLIERVLCAESAPSAYATLPIWCRRLDAGSGVFCRRYEATALTVLVAIVSWVADNLGCEALHALPLALPYPQLHALVWHLGMARVCHFLCQLVVAGGGSQKKE